MTKEGNFDWIFGYDQLKDYFEETVLQLSVPKQLANVLVVGCGTSTLSQKLYCDSNFGRVVSIDYDSGCIDHMKQIHSSDSRVIVRDTNKNDDRNSVDDDTDNSREDSYDGVTITIQTVILTNFVVAEGCRNGSTTSVISGSNEGNSNSDSNSDSNIISNSNSNEGKLVWYRYDLVEDFNKPQNNELDIDQRFDIIVDKGTFDAIHVEGTVTTMLCNIHRLLKVQGVYLIFSINTEELLLDLLSMEEFHFSCRSLGFHDSTKKGNSDKSTNSTSSTYGTYGSDNKASGTPTVIICRKIAHNTEFDVRAIEDKEIAIQEKFFQLENPLLTKALEQEITTKFSNSGNKLELLAAYEIMFGSNSSLGYSYDLFLEDLESFELKERDSMTVEEALSFINSMQ